MTLVGSLAPAVDDYTLGLQVASSLRGKRVLVSERVSRSTTADARLEEKDNPTPPMIYTLADQSPETKEVANG
jgi:hypothetical protein